MGQPDTIEEMQSKDADMMKRIAGIEYKLCLLSTEAPYFPSMTGAMYSLADFSCEFENSAAKNVLKKIMVISFNKIPNRKPSFVIIKVLQEKLLFYQNFYFL